MKKEKKTSKSKKEAIADNLKRANELREELKKLKEERAELNEK